MRRKSAKSPAKRTCQKKKRRLSKQKTGSGPSLLSRSKPKRKGSAVSKKPNASQPARRRKSAPDFTKIFFIPDTHVPYHDKRAFRLARSVCKEFKPDVVVILGDFADFYSVSSHEKSPDRKYGLVEEAKQVRRCLKALNRSAPNARKIYVCGNHENRLERYIKNKAPELFNVTTIEQVLDLENLGWEFIPYFDYAKIGRLIITHDTGAAGKNAHRKSLIDAGSGNSIVIGHTHRAAYEAHRTTDGKLVSAGSFGWLGDPSEIEYANKATLNQWVQGVGLGYVLKDGTPVTSFVPFIDYKCVLEGKLIRDNTDLKLV